MAYKLIGAIGDSITDGFWDDNTAMGWFGRLGSKISAKHPYAGKSGE
jgi:lysophospholipase L1-like esterase